jgi:hypothetical protein
MIWRRLSRPRHSRSFMRFAAASRFTLTPCTVCLPACECAARRWAWPPADAARGSCEEGGAAPTTPRGGAVPSGGCGASLCKSLPLRPFNNPCVSATCLGVRPMLCMSRFRQPPRSAKPLAPAAPLRRVHSPSLCPQLARVRQQPLHECHLFEGEPHARHLPLPSATGAALPEANAMCSPVASLRHLFCMILRIISIISRHANGLPGAPRNSSLLVFSSKISPDLRRISIG